MKKTLSPGALETRKALLRVKNDFGKACKGIKDAQQLEKTTRDNLTQIDEEIK